MFGTGFIVDFTWDGEQLKILELGWLENAGTQDYDCLYPDSPIDKNYDVFLKEALGNQGYMVSLNKVYDKGVLLSSLNPLEQKELGAHLLGCNQKHLVNFLITLASIPSPQKMIIKFHGELASSVFKVKGFNEFKSWYDSYSKPDSALVLIHPNQTFYDACKNKKVLDGFLQGNPIYPKTYSGDFANLDLEKIQQFISEMTYSHFVLKPNASSGRGVIILKKEEVFPFLEKIKKGDCEDAYWKKNKEAPFLLQTCVPSKMIKVANKAYRPTGRLVMVTTGKKEEPFKCIGAYYKLPEHALDETAHSHLSTENLVSRISSRTTSNSDAISAIVPDEELELILQQFNLHFTSPYRKMIGADSREPIFPNSMEEKLDNIFEFVKHFHGYDRGDIPRIVSMFVGLPFAIVKAANSFPFMVFEKLVRLYYANQIKLAFFEKVVKSDEVRSQLHKFAEVGSGMEYLETYFNLLKEGQFTLDEIKQHSPLKLKLLLRGIQHGFSKEAVISYFFSEQHIQLVKNGFTAQEVGLKGPQQTQKLLRAFYYGFTLEDLRAPWFSFDHIDAVAKKIITIEESRQLNRMEVLKRLNPPRDSEVKLAYSKEEISGILESFCKSLN